MLLTTRLSPPLPRPDAFRRPGLEARLRAGLDQPLSLVAAPAGFGKTGLASITLAAERPAWLSLAPDDNQPEQFCASLVAAVQRVAPDVAAPAAFLLRDTPPQPLREVVAALVNATAALPPGERLVVVLDDYHQIDDPAIHALLNDLLDHTPPQLRLLLLSRADPPLALSRRRARGELSELRAADLRFSEAEIDAFLGAALPGPLAPALRAMVAERSEGWAASLQLFALALAGAPRPAERLRELAGTDRLLLDYLADEVLAHQPDEVQQFLLRTAILDQLSAGLCAALLADLELPEVESLLERVERAGLFLSPLDAERRWFRYHQLFAELLRQRLRRALPAPAVAELHAQAAVWHSAHGSVTAAIRHALAANRAELAIAAVEARYLEPVRQVAPQELATWLAQLPGPACEQRPRLLLADAWRALYQLDLPALGRRLAQLEAHAAPGVDPLLGAELVAVAGRTALLRQEFAAVVARSQAALAALSPEPSFVRGCLLLNLGFALRFSADLAAADATMAEAAAVGRAIDEPTITIAALLTRANLRQVAADLAGAEQLLRHALVVVGADPAAPLAEMIGICLGWLLAERGDLAQATDLLTAGLEAARRRRSARGILDGSTYLMLVEQMRGDVVAADRAALVAASLAAEAGPGLLADVIAERVARRDLLRGEWGAALHWARARAPQPPLREHADDVVLTWAWAHVEAARAGDRSAAAQAQAALAPLIARSDAGGLKDLGLRARLLAAAAYDAAGDPSSALRVLGEALGPMLAAGYQGAFLSLGEPMRRLVTAALSDGAVGQAERPAALRLLARFPRSEPEPQAQLAEPLSEREREVLALLGAGLSNAEIAERLVVALTTVKAHLRSIYAKLDVDSRTRALARARELGLLL